MKFDPTVGTLELFSGADLRPYMRRNDLLSLPLLWETWYTTEENEAIAYRAVIASDMGMKGEKVTLIVYFEPDDGKIAFWMLRPFGRLYGNQNRPEGKLTKLTRKWFTELTGEQLPQQGDWGQVDAHFDPHNQEAHVTCRYSTGNNLEPLG